MWLNVSFDKLKPSVSQRTFHQWGAKYNIHLVVDQCVVSFALSIICRLIFIEYIN